MNSLRPSKHHRPGGVGDVDVAARSLVPFICMTHQLALRISDELAQQLDGMIGQGRYANRTEAVRTAIVALVERERRAAVGDAIVAGYRRQPETTEELATAETNLRGLLVEEPW